MVNISDLADNSPSEGGIWVFNKPKPPPPPPPLSINEFDIFRDSLKDGNKGPEMVWIPAGSFQMGSEEIDDVKPVHEVSVDRFAVGKYQVTFDEYDKFAEVTKKNKPSDEGWGRGKRPVINLSWEDAVAYTKWLSEQTGKTYRLPTEAEWEYMARAGTTTRYCFGDDESSLGDYAWYSKNSSGSTHPVGEKKPNAWGLYDVHGNVWEWCADIYGNYSSESRSNPTGPSAGGETGSYRVIRGGAWDDTARYARTAYRNYSSPEYRSGNVGFRLVRTPS